MTKRIITALILLSVSATLAGFPRSSLERLVRVRRADVYAADQFATTWNLTVDDEAGRTITLPLRSGFTYDFEVDWGDGNTATVTAHDDADRIHVYATTGIKTVTMTGTLQAWYFNNGGDKLKFLTVEHWGADVGFTGMGLISAFHGCANAISFGDAMPAYAVTSLVRTWANCSDATAFPDVSALISVTTLYETWFRCSTATAFPDVSALILVDDLFRAWRECVGASSFPSVSALTSVTRISEAWLGCFNATVVPALPSASTALTTTTSAFQNIGAGMGGTVEALWNTTNFPNITSFDNAFTGATGLDNYADIPNAWKGL